MKISRNQLEQIANLCRGNDTENDPEQCGWILATNEVIEVENIASEPTTSAQYSHIPPKHKILASWHSHPGGNYCAKFSNSDIESANDFGKASLMYHPKSGKFFGYCPNNEVDFSAIDDWNNNSEIDLNLQKLAEWRTRLNRLSQQELSLEIEEKEILVSAKKQQLDQKKQLLALKYGR